ncbi:MAG: flagellar motor protein MotA, partial [Alphaproteobacteria bacterium]|nr:flagellar motor protein MotA [Alphaproteobacteria bacterium]
MRSTVVGIVGVFAILAIVLASEGDLSYYWNPLGATIVMGGVVATALLGFRLGEVGAAVAAVGAIFREDPTIDEDVEELVEVARALHGHRVKEAEKEAQTVKSPFVRLGVQLVVDGTPLDDLLHVMNWRVQKMIERESAQARLFRTLASLAPGFGLVGTLAGMVGMLKQLGSGDIAQIGASMAVAMLATLYGVVLSNLLFKPIATKLEQRTLRRVALLNVLLEGVVLMRLGRSPTVIKDAMEALLSEG